MNYSHLGRTQLSLPSLIARETLSSLGVGQLLPLGTMCGHMTLKANVPNRIDILIPGQFGSLFRRCFDAFELLPVPVTCWRRARI